MVKKFLTLLFLASVSLTEIMAGNFPGKANQEMADFLNLSFGFTNRCANTTFKIASSKITGTVISFFNASDIPSYEIPANGTAIGDNVSIQLRYKLADQVFKNPQMFQEANTDPDSIAFTNGEQGALEKKFTIQIFPVLENETGLALATKIKLADIVNVGIQEMAFGDQDYLTDFEVQDIQ